MIYLDNGATSLHKPPEVARAVLQAMQHCGNPGRGGHKAAMQAAETVYRCRETASELFDCQPEQVVFTKNCTEGLNIAVNTLVKPGDRVVVTGFEHNAVMRPLYSKGAQIVIAGKKLFDPTDTLTQFEKALKSGVSAAVFTHCSNVFGYILPVEEMAALCRYYRVPFAIDCAQSAGSIPLSLKRLGADFLAMPGHKGLLGPQGTGILLCARAGEPVLYGGTGTDSENHGMPQQLPERLEAGTLNVPGIAGLNAGLTWLKRRGIEELGNRERQVTKLCANKLKKSGYRVFSGEYQGSTVSFVADMDCEEMAQQLGQQGIAVRAGLHCAPLAHESAGTLKTGTVRVSFGMDAGKSQVDALIKALARIGGKKA